jgi:hypothetical protein
MMEFGTLVLEVTRRCDMECSHCLRGEARDLDIKHEFIDQVLDRTESVATVVFSGGEPSLNTGAITYFRERCQALDIPVGSFFISTNASRIRPEFALELLRLQAFCEDQEICSLLISADAYHQEHGLYEDCESYRFYRGLSCCSMRDNAGTYYDPIRMGRADDWSRARRHEPDGPPETRMEFTDATVYLAADGGVWFDCELRYDIMDAEPVVRAGGLGDFYERLEE